MFQSLTNRKQFVVTCKKCQHDVPSALCSEKHRYLPSEVLNFPEGFATITIP